MKVSQKTAKKFTVSIMQGVYSDMESSIVEINNRIITDGRKDINFLFDSTVFCRFEELGNYFKIDPLAIILALPKVAVFVSNYVLEEIIQKGKRYEKYNFIILNSEYSARKGAKEKRFILPSGKLIMISNISTADYSSLVLLANHEELILVSNDLKQLRSGQKIFEPGTVIGIPMLIEGLKKSNQDVGDLEEKIKSFWKFEPVNINH